MFYQSINRPSRLIPLLGLLLIPLIVVAAHSQPSAVSPPLQQWHFFTNDTGWVRQSDRLYVTSNAGQTWQERTPDIPDNAYWHTLNFDSPETGWGLFSTLNEEGTPLFTLATTTNSGESWDWHELSLFSPDAVDAFISKATFFFLDEDNGWLLTKQATGSNFDAGALFFTADGGQTWTRRTAPISGDMLFVTTDLGWLTGGINQNELYRTTDGGVTWTMQQIAAEGSFYQRPFFTSTTQGLLPVLVDNQLVLFQTENGGSDWGETAVIPLTETPGTTLPFYIADADHWYLNAAQIDSSVSLEPPVLPINAPPDTLFADIKMITPTNGWVAGSTQTCIEANCFSTDSLYHTNDAGNSWTAISLPAPAVAASLLQTPEFNTLNSVNTTSSNIVTMKGQGFDKCEIATLSQMQAWKNNSPYDAVNLYIGGISRACANSALSANYLDQMSQQGWKFIPTWVGLQASCSGYGNRMSSNATTAYNQGRTEANNAATVAANLGLANSDRSGTIIYYDLEAYDTTNVTCRNAAKAFINGWVERLEELGNQSGVYGSACGSAVDDFSNISNVPDQIWPAHWIYNSYNIGASIWNVACINNGKWVNSQRIRQYAGGHNESWGNVTLNIDSNVIDGKVVDISSASPTAPTSVVVQPTISPSYSGGMCGTAWYRFAGYNGSYAYLTLSTNNPANSTNSGKWRATLPQTGNYKVEAYIANHSPINWQCPSKYIPGDTSDARYTIYRRGGQTTVKGNQLPLANQWLNLNVHAFNGGTAVLAKLTDLNGEAHLSHTISYSAMRFTLQRPDKPTNVSASDGTYSDRVVISWNAAFGAKSYQVFRATSASGPKTRIGAPTGTSFTDTSAAANKTYYYWVKAVNPAGTSSYSSSNSGYVNQPSQPPQTDRTPPTGNITQPGAGNSLTYGRGDTVRLEAVASDASSGVKRVEFWVRYNGKWHLIKEEYFAPYEADFNIPTSLKSQQIEVGIHVVDNAGNVAIDPGGKRSIEYISGHNSPVISENWVPANRRAYLNQRSLSPYGDAKCGASSAAMVLAMNGKITRDYDSLAATANQIFPNTKAGDGQIYAYLVANQMTKKGLPSAAKNFSYENEWKKITSEIDAGRPLIMLSWKVTRGHFFVVVGYKETVGDPSTRELIVYDPYGKWRGTDKGDYNRNVAVNQSSTIAAKNSRNGQWVYYNFTAVRSGWLIVSGSGANNLVIQTIAEAATPSTPPDLISDEPENIGFFEGLNIETEHRIFIPIAIK